MKSILHSIGAVIAGSLAIGIVSFIADFIISKITPDIFSIAGRSQHPALLALMAAYSVAFAAVGGYVTASLAPRAPMKHVIALAVLELMGGAGAAYQAGDMLPRWFSAVVVILPVPAILLAGALKSRTSGPSLAR
jgi:hypothetical protein